MKLNDGTKITKEFAVLLISTLTDLEQMEEKISEYGRMTSEENERNVCENISDDLEKLITRINNSIK